MTCIYCNGASCVYCRSPWDIQARREPESDLVRVSLIHRPSGQVGWFVVTEYDVSERMDHVRETIELTAKLILEKLSWGPRPDDDAAFVPTVAPLPEVEREP